MGSLADSGHKWKKCFLGFKIGVIIHCQKVKWYQTPGHDLFNGILTAFMRSNEWKACQDQDDRINVTISYLQKTWEFQTPRSHTKLWLNSERLQNLVDMKPAVAGSTLNPWHGWDLARPNQDWRAIQVYKPFSMRRGSQLVTCLTFLLISALRLCCPPLASALSSSSKARI